MHTKLLNIGFIKMPDGSYHNAELGITILIVDNEHVSVPTPQGPYTATLLELEEAIVAGGYGDL